MWSLGNGKLLSNIGCELFVFFLIESCRLVLSLSVQMETW